MRGGMLCLAPTYLIAFKKYGEDVGRAISLSTSCKKLFCSKGRKILMAHL
jgi:hypothetical protein